MADFHFRAICMSKIRCTNEDSDTIIGHPEKILETVGLSRHTAPGKLNSMHPMPADKSTSCQA